MRKYGPPFCGSQFLLNTNTGEIHDLDNEFESCQISEIAHEHVVMFSTLERALQHAPTFTNKECNGCAYCLSQYDTDKFN